MRRLFCFLLLANMFGCSSGGADGSKHDPGVPPISSPTGFSVEANRDGSVSVAWQESGDLTYDLYSSTDPSLDPANYSAYDQSGYAQNVRSPHQFTPSEASETYTFKLVARSHSSQSDPATATAYTRFSISQEEPSRYVDALLNLEVKRCSEGQQYDYLAEQCLNDAKRYTPAELSTHLEAAGDGWRLPTTAELDGLSPCNLSGIQPVCVPRAYANIITDFFLGSSIAAYYDVTAQQPYFENGRYWHMAHGFPDEYRGVKVNYGSSPVMYAVLVRSLTEDR
jgi:hypothetical protein